VILNLIINAVEAMSSVRDGSRELLISTRKEVGGVIVAVRDTGAGLSPESFGVCSTRSTPPRPTGWVSDFRFAVRSSRLTEDGVGPRASSARGQPFSSACRYPALNKRLTPDAHAFDAAEHVAAERHPDAALVDLQRCPERLLSDFSGSLGIGWY
jgi:hypothetical protein